MYIIIIILNFFILFFILHKGEKAPSPRCLVVMTVKLENASCVDDLNIVMGEAVLKASYPHLPVLWSGTGSSPTV